MNPEGRGPRAEGRGDAGNTGPGTIRGFRDLVAWQRGHELAVRVIRETREFPSVERFGLGLQMRRAAVSVPSNIAEGFGRGSREDYTRFLYIARGSLYELTTQVSIAAEVGYLASDAHADLTATCDECERILWGLIRALERRTDRS